MSLFLAFRLDGGPPLGQPGDAAKKKSNQSDQKGEQVKAEVSHTHYCCEITNRDFR